MKISWKIFMFCFFILFCVFNGNSFSEKKMKTVVTGESMEMIDAGKRVIFSGNARVVHGQDVLNADEIVQDKVSDVVNAKGNVNFQTVSDDNELIKGTADRAVYNLTTKSGQLSEKRPKLYYVIKNSTSPVTVQADIIDINQGANRADAAGNVVIISSSASAYSGRALFVYSDKKLFLTGTTDQPKIFYFAQGRKDRFFADKITMFVDKKRIILEGNVKGFVKEMNKK